MYIKIVSFEDWKASKDARRAQTKLKVKEAEKREQKLLEEGMRERHSEMMQRQLDTLMRQQARERGKTKTTADKTHVAPCLKWGYTEEELEGVATATPKLNLR